MGSAVGAELVRRGTHVIWASEGRSEDSARRAAQAGLDDARTAAELARQSEVILSICPPHAAADVARSVAGFAGLFVDANAIAPLTVREIAEPFGSFVDGGIVGGPPGGDEVSHLYLSGPDAASVAELFDGTAMDARVISGDVGAASAMKVVYAAWTKGTAAMLLAINALAQAEGVEPVLAQEWAESQPQLPERLKRARRSGEAKGWRWVAEMEEIAATFAAHDLPDGFHLAAAEVFRAFSDERSPAWQPGARS